MVKNGKQTNDEKRTDARRAQQRAVVALDAAVAGLVALCEHGDGAYGNDALLRDAGLVCNNVARAERNAENVVGFLCGLDNPDDERLRDAAENVRDETGDVERAVAFHVAACFDVDTDAGRAALSRLVPDAWSA